MYGLLFNFGIMKIPSNRVSSVIKYFREQLHGLYEKEEIENFIYYCFNEYMSFSRADLLSRTNDTMSESMLLKFNFAVKDLRKNKPVQYILESAWFYGLKLKVDERVLIPRQETEELVDLIIKENKNDTLSILDFGTGSGCIAIALKKHLPLADVMALDVSEGALALAAENAKANGAEVKFFKGDILDHSSIALESRLDIIVSNPPYVLASEKASMHGNVLEHEPHLALFVNDTDPLIFYRKIMEFSKSNLKPGGKLYFEINEQQGRAMEALAAAEGMTDIKVIKDINGKDRIMYARLADN